jgi:hypothetical protein
MMSGIVDIMSDTHTIPATYTTGDLAKHFDRPVWQILQTMRRGFLEEPPRIGIYRVWTEADLPRVRQALIEAGYLPEPREATHA